MQALACDTGNTNRMPQVGQQLFGQPQSNPVCPSTFVGDTPPSTIYVPSPNNGSWFIISVTQNGNGWYASSVQELRLSLRFNKTTPSGGRDSSERIDVAAPLYQTGKPYRPRCDMNNNGQYDDNNS